jgi:membrane protein involved in colicin uptake
LEKKV